MTTTTFTPILTLCRSIFQKKLLDYGPTWLIFRWPSLIDQIFIKLSRLRALEESLAQWIDDTPRDEYYGIINYCLVGILKDRGELPTPEDILQTPDLLETIPPEAILSHYDDAAASALHLLALKNHDYGEAWRGMAVSSITDQMLIKILRVKHLLGSGRAVDIADSLPAQLMDILNYCLFSLILTEGSQGPTTLPAR